MPGRKRPIVQPSPQKQDGPKAAEDDPKNVLQKMEHERPQKYLRSLCQPHASASRLSLRLRRSGSFQLECSAIRRASASRSQSVSSMAKATPAGSSCAVRLQSKKGPGSLFRPGAINSCPVTHFTGCRRQMAGEKPAQRLVLCRSKRHLTGSFEFNPDRKIIAGAASAEV